MINLRCTRCGRDDQIHSYPKTGGLLFTCGCGQRGFATLDPPRIHALTEREYTILAAAEHPAGLLGPLGIGGDC